VAHERLEFAVLKRQRLHLRYLDLSGLERQSLVMPLDVYTRDGGEWLVVQDEAGDRITIRLDRILNSEPVAAA
jgi:predicted DNA-binding transcriptional regulator YafY